MFLFQSSITLEQCLFGILPTAFCLSPYQELHRCYPDVVASILTMDHKEFESEVFQRPFQYLSGYSTGKNLDYFSFSVPRGNIADCIQELLKYCSVSDPTWSELRHFASFLNNQLRDCEKSVFCNTALVGIDSGLSGFKSFVVRFMIRMSQDFATPSLAGGKSVNSNSEIFELHQLRRRWEEDPHPYLFFNEDKHSLTFLNFSVDNRGNLMHPKKSSTCLEAGLLPRQLLAGLTGQNVNINQNFDLLTRQQKLATLCRVMGLSEVFDFDPDPNYEVTTDNVLKMLAIHMRFRCDIPVVLMGETGCGKTRMVEFMSKLKLKANQKLKKRAKSIKNMVVVKVHGGITVPVIQRKMREAAALAQKNKRQYDIDTMLFLDEANTTEAIYAIKEYVCDGTIGGEIIDAPGLQVICACNPYRQHSSEAIKKMSEAGLGFRVKTEDTNEKLGNIPMRCLVYRVIALPPSMHPLVWDFGQLSTKTEMVYIQQMVLRLNNRRDYQKILSSKDSNLIAAVLSASQTFMREERSQCLFVSLRDVERCLKSFMWFHQNSSWLYKLIDENRELEASRFFTVSVRCLIHAIGMCYHVTLEERDAYRKRVSQCLQKYGFEINSKMILDEITACQSVFCNSLDLEDNIAPNEALRENSFMIAMCAEMRIPLFLIGKPGSSKSLAKTVITDAMQGPSAKSEVFRKLKQIHVLSFQCSAVSDAVGIEAVFAQCVQVQKNQDSKKFVSVVVLDEIGLAEDSPKMPLKVLHPLLEGSSVSFSFDTAGDVVDTFFASSNVGFVGISNWALDPAKMNRGIFVIRGDPSNNDLALTAKGIFSSDERRFREVDQVVKLLTESYLDIRSKQDHEFFGLRDYYGLLKMIFSIVKKDDTDLDYFHVSDAIKRNFSGGEIDCFEIFLNRLRDVWPDARPPTISVKKMITDNLESINDCESRFLLLLTNRFEAINLLDRIVDSRNFQVIFGSSFPQDNDYTELCKNINKIKVCMESGTTIVLLNLRDLYESLYDALNQHYVTFAGQRYVDLGLGGHRVKCRIAKNFRLIVIEDKSVVYNEFPIPLINRLEKYIFTSESVLDGDNLQVASRIKSWVEMFSEIKIPTYKRQFMKQFSVQQSFIGYSEDSAASAVLNAVGSISQTAQLQQSAQYALLETATTDSVFRLPLAKLKKEAVKFQRHYLFEQSHDNLITFFRHLINQAAKQSLKVVFMFEITSFSQILSENDRQKFEQALELSKNSVMLLTLQQFQTQDDFLSKVKSFFEFIFERNADDSLSTTFLLLMQCPQVQKQSDLVACSRFTVKNVIRDKYFSKIKDSDCKVIIAFLYTMDRQYSNEVKAFENKLSFHSSDFFTVFIDELRPTVDYIGPPSMFWNKSIGEVFEEAVLHYHCTNTQFPCRFMDPGFLLDPIVLIRSSIPVAMLKVTSQRNQERNRVQLLHKLFDDSYFIASVPFRNILLERIIGLLKKRDANIDSAAWSVEEACCQQALCEAGTFSKTLWHRLRKTVSLVLAKIVSVIDEDNNLDILCQEKPNKILVNFWLHVFESADEICKISCNEILINSNEFEIQGSVVGLQCLFPFSRRITKYFSQIWSFAEVEMKPSREKFFRRLNELKINRYFLELLSSDQIASVERYIKDLVYLKCNFAKSSLEFQLLADCLKSMFFALHQNRSNGSCDFQDNYIALIYYTFASCQQQLEQMHMIFEIFPEILTEANAKSWCEKQNSSVKFIVHGLAYSESLSFVEKHFDNLALPQQHRKWKSQVRSLLNLKLELSQNAWSATDNSPQLVTEVTKKIHSMRSSLAFVDLFLSVLVPEQVSEETFEHYLKVLVPISKRLWNGAKIQGLNNARFLRLLIKYLQNCAKDIYLNILLSWRDISCNLCPTSKILDPVILPCEHYFCQKCIVIATTGSKQCPICRINLPENFTITVEKLSPEKTLEFDNFNRNCISFFFQHLSTLCFPLNCENALTEISLNKDVWEILESIVVQCKGKLTPVNMETFDEAPTVRSFVLQLLLRFDRQSTQEMLKIHLEKMENVVGHKKELMVIYTRCLEDLLQVKVKEAKNKSLQSFESQVDDLVSQAKEEYLNYFESKDQIKALDLVVKIRLLIKIAVELAHEVYSVVVVDANVQSAKSSLRLICDCIQSCNFDLAKIYFVKLLCRMYGFAGFRRLVEKGEYLELIPSEVNHKDITATFSSANCYLFDSNYAETYKSLMHFKSEENVKELAYDFSLLATQSNDSLIGVLYAIQVWIRETSDKDLGFLLFDDFLEELLNNSCIDKHLLKFFDDVIRLRWPASCLPSTMASFLQDFVLIAGSTILLSSQCNILYDLKQIINNSKNIGNFFLPTMPQSSFFDVKFVVQQWIDPSHKVPPKAYLCPQGHQYYIGDCTNPSQKSNCPVCGQPIGASRYGQLQPGNVAGELTERSQAGYLLGAPSSRSLLPIPERGCSRLAVCVMRMFLHAAMLHAARNENHIMR